MPNAKSKPESVAEMKVDATTLGGLVGISRQRVGQLASEGVFVRTGGKFKLGESVARYISHLREDARRTTRSAAEQRVQEARARSIELRNAEKERALIQLSESLAAIDCFCGIVLTELGCLSGLIAERDVAARRAVDAQVRVVRQRITDRIAAVADAHRSGASLDEAVRRTAANGTAT